MFASCTLAAILLPMGHLKTDKNKQTGEKQQICIPIYSKKNYCNLIFFDSTTVKCLISFIYACLLTLVLIELMMDLKQFQHWLLAFLSRSFKMQKKSIVKNKLLWFTKYAPYHYMKKRAYHHICKIEKKNLIVKYEIFLPHWIVGRRLPI